MKLSVLASSANLGCGYDTLGIGLNLVNEFAIDHAPEDTLIGEERDLSTHMVFTTRNLACSMLGLSPKPFVLKVNAQIPEAGGLGSSATCILAGVVAALYLNDKPLDEQIILETATRIEGHPDNVVPAYTGGLTAALGLEGKVLYQKFKVDDKLTFLTVIPPFEFETQGSRAAIPAMIRHTDAVSNLARVVLLTKALEKGDTTNLKDLFHDELHQKYRLPLIGQIDPNYPSVFKYCSDHSEGTFLSGAGPTFISVVDDETAARLMEELKIMVPGYRVLALKSNNGGAIVTE
ncbi:MAG: homoserine kinase [Clostridiaceae bacterium]